MTITNLDKARIALTARRVANTAAVDEFLQCHPDTSVVDISVAVGVSFHSTVNYLNALRKNGCAHVSTLGDNSGRGRQRNYWSSGPGNVTETAPGTAWPSESITRYDMGRAI